VANGGHAKGGGLWVQEWDVKLGSSQGNCCLPRYDAVLLYVVYVMMPSSVRELHDANGKETVNSR
jgi:hypothetical protein